LSFTRGVLLGDLDAPIGGQSQTNAQTILIRLFDNSVQPSRFRMVSTPTRAALAKRPMVRTCAAMLAVCRVRMLEP
jgi:hypothetical protein